MKNDEEILNDLILCYEHHQEQANKYARIISILRGSEPKPLMEKPAESKQIEQEPAVKVDSKKKYHRKLSAVSDFCAHCGKPLSKDKTTFPDHCDKSCYMKAYDKRKRDKVKQFKESEKASKSNDKTDLNSLIEKCKNTPVLSCTKVERPNHYHDC